MAIRQGTVESLVTPAGFWKGRRVFLTGHTGFKGGWLALWLQQLGALVTGFSLEPLSQPNLFGLAQVARDMTSILGDITDLPVLASAMRDAKPEVVMHLAAQPLVRAGYEQPLETYRTNVMGTLNLLEAARSIDGLRAIVIVTTDKCYENREWSWAYRENDALGGFDPYSNSKACAELVTQSYRNSFFQPQRYAEHGVAIATARAGNVIGGGDWGEDRLVPDALRAFLAQQPVLIRNPGAIRPWQHVLEPLLGYLQLAQRLTVNGVDFGESWNLGPHLADARPVAWVVEELAQRWGAGASWVRDQGPHPHEAHFLKLDSGKAQSRLHWNSRLNISTTLDWTVEWYRAWQAGADLRALCLAQINRYEQQA